MSSEYVDNLIALKAREAHDLKEIGDQWRTPDWLFFALDNLFGPLVLDLFTDGQNAKCTRYYTAEDNALRQDWAGRLKAIQAELEAEAEVYDVADHVQRVWGFANPPYSRNRAAEVPLTGMVNIMAKAEEERKKGAGTVWLIKAATAETWWPDTIATRTIFIKGRIGFEPPVWFKAKTGAAGATSAGFGAAIVIFDPEDDEKHAPEYISREALMDIGLPMANIMQDVREKWIAQWDEV